MEQVETLEAFASFDPAQDKVLAILPLISGFTSCCASIWIIVEVATTRIKLRTVYNRLLLAMSIVDVLSSIGHMLGPLPLPEEYDGEVAWAKGNNSTCNAQGFLVQLSIVTPICTFQFNALSMNDIGKITFRILITTPVPNPFSLSLSRERFSYC